MDKQTKIYRTFAVSLEDNESAIPTLVGTAVLFNVNSSDCGGWVDNFRPGCFTNLDADILAYYNHNSDHVLGRTSNGRLKLDVNDQAITISLNMSDTSVAKDIITLITDETIKGMSFGCWIDESEWDIDQEIPVQYITKARLVEVTITGNPSFKDTDVLIKRSLDEAIREADLRKRQIEEAKFSQQQHMKMQIAVRKKRSFSI